MPTEAQWEYATRGGLGYEYGTVDGTLDLSLANYSGRSSPGEIDPAAPGHPVRVGSYPANPGAAYDCNARLKRGGSWNFHATTIRSDARNTDYAFRGNDHFGFRLVGAAESAAPNAAFEFSISGLTVRFTDRSEDVIDSRVWDFGDGSQSGEQNPDHTYGASGTYIAGLTVCGNGFCDTSSSQVTVDSAALSVTRRRAVRHP